MRSGINRFTRITSLTSIRFTRDRKSQNWRDVAVSYDPFFKQYDRFQYPLTRGRRLQQGWDDSRVRMVVGVIATVVYLSEVFPKRV